MTPPTTNIARVIDALATSKAELEYQAQRLEEMVAADTDSERKHLKNVAKSYRDAAHTTGMLLKYQEGRQRRYNEQQQAAANTAATAAHTNDNEDDGA